MTSKERKTIQAKPTEEAEILYKNLSSEQLTILEAVKLSVREDLLKTIAPKNIACIRKGLSPFLSTVASVLFGLSFVCVTEHSASSATFKYTSGTTETIYIEGETTREGITYDGTFINSIFDPFAQMFRQFSGVFSIINGSLGEAVTVAAVQISPIDRLSLGEEGIARTEYLADLQDVALIPGAITFPPGLREFDFKFVPAPVAGVPTVLARGWSVNRVNEPGAIVTLGFLGGGLLMIRKR